MNDFINQIRKLPLYRLIGEIFYNFKFLIQYIFEAKRLGNEAMYITDPEELIEIISTSNTFITNQKPSEINQLLQKLGGLDAKNILEIGTRKGGTLFLFCQKCNLNAKIISLDIKFPSNAYKKSIKYLCRKGQKINCIEGDSHDEAVYQKIKSILRDDFLDFLFIDGDHSYDGIRQDYVRYSSLVRTGGIIALHDIVADSYLRSGNKSASIVGQVPVFWKEIRENLPDAKELIDDVEQDGYGIGYHIKK